MVASYATKEQVQEWLEGTEYADELPTGGGLGRLLARASEVIHDAVTGQVGYDDDDLPESTVPVADPVIPAQALRDAFADAVCAQVEQWFEVGESNDIAGWGPGTKMQLSAGAVSELPDQLAPRAARRLARVGLNPGGTATSGGASGPLTVELV